MYHPHIPHPRILSFWMNTLPAAGLAGVDRVSRMTLSESGTTFCLSEAWQIISQLKSSDVVTCCHYNWACSVPMWSGSFESWWRFQMIPTSQSKELHMQAHAHRKLPNPLPAPLSYGLRFHLQGERYLSCLVSIRSLDCMEMYAGFHVPSVKPYQKLWTHLHLSIRWISFYHLRCHARRFRANTARHRHLGEAGATTQREDPWPGRDASIHCNASRPPWWCRYQKFPQHSGSESNVLIEWTKMTRKRLKKHLQTILSLPLKVFSCFSDAVGLWQSVDLGDLVGIGCKDSGGLAHALSPWDSQLMVAPCSRFTF